MLRQNSLRIMRLWKVAAALMMAAFSASSWAGGSPVNGSCHALLSLADARELAAATPNARAFHNNLGAVLTTRVAHTNANGSVAVSVMAKEPKQGITQVGVYTVNLRTGHVTDDDQEPAEDEQTGVVRERLAARHCASK